MAESRTLKLKEYGTDIISHSNNNENEAKNVRFNNTFKSSILDGPEEQR